MKIAKNRGMARARVAVARKLAVSCTACGATKPSSASARSPRGHSRHARLTGRRTTEHDPPREGEPGRSRGDDGRGDLVESPEPACGRLACKVVKQIEMPGPPDPIMRRPRADREEKRVTRGGGTSGTQRKTSRSS
jgi:hypothetical protein